MTTTVGFNPYALKLKHIIEVERAFGIKFTSMITRLEKRGEMDLDDLSGMELCALVYMMKVLEGDEVKVADITDMSLQELFETISAPGTEIEAAPANPTSGG